MHLSNSTLKTALSARTKGKVYDQVHPAKLLTYWGIVWEVKWCVTGKKKKGSNFTGKRHKIHTARANWWFLLGLGSVRLINICFTAVQNNTLSFFFFFFWAEFLSVVGSLWTSYAHTGRTDLLLVCSNTRTDKHVMRHNQINQTNILQTNLQTHTYCTHHRPKHTHIYSWCVPMPGQTVSEHEAYTDKRVLGF